MSCAPRTSDMIARIRDRLKPHIHGGVWLSSEDVYGLVRSLNTAHAVAIESEDDLSILQREARLRPGPRQVEITALGPNVVRIPVRPRLTVVPTGGGDAA